MAHLTSFARAFRTPDLRRKLLFTLGLIVVFRFGSAVPAPGISAANVRYCAGLESSRGTAEPAGPGGELAGTSGGPAALTLS